MADNGGTILALDVGATRIGMARASTAARLAAPAGAMQHTDDILERLRTWCSDEHVTTLVVGMPRGLNGQETQQTKAVRLFGEGLARAVDLPVHWQDEAVTSVRAEEELAQRGKPYRKEDIDALAATYILEDYLREGI